MSGIPQYHRRTSRLVMTLIVSGILATQMPAPAAIADGAQAGPVTAGGDPRFGLNQAWENGATADRAGAGWSRLTFWWSAFQPKSTSEWNAFATDNDSYIN